MTTMEQDFRGIVSECGSIGGRGRSECRVAVTEAYKIHPKIVFLVALCSAPVAVSRPRRKREDRPLPRHL